MIIMIINIIIIVISIIIITCACGGPRGHWGTAAGADARRARPWTPRQLMNHYYYY